MKIRTIIGILLVFALVLGSTGFALYAYDDDKGKGNQETIIPDPVQDRDRDWNEVCDPDGDTNCKGWN